MFGRVIKDRHPRHGQTDWRCVDAMTDDKLTDSAFLARTLSR
jgi:hypothetical protein